ncbi:hypothetical protein [Thomasclavelia cocleata]|uniref:hypothetical protein n=1 Tax=Thomasclavelia cocleata TaxID=69824 RepID=UPI00242BAAF9|nr:hypothetical protein [Thomasclavelia cocleata]
MKNQFDDVILMKEELQLLKKIHKNPHFNINDIPFDKYRLFLSYGFIERDYSGKIDYRGQNIFDNTVCTTANYKRFLKNRKNNFIERKFPIIISCIALVISIIALIKQ